MLLVHKPQPALSSPSSHRRQSSAPIVVQPTRIPGLLSLSKPPRPSPPRHQRYNVKNAPKQALTTSPAPSVVRAHAQTLTPAGQIYTAPATPSPHSRGRPNDKHSKDKVLRNKRSASQSSLRGSGSGKHNGRQPSPPILSTMTTSNKQKSSQAEVPTNFNNHFDPFVDQTTLTPSPSLRKQHPHPKSKAIPVPTSSTQRTPALARSDPLPFLLNRQPRHQQRPGLITKRAVTTREFPICDDMSEIADDHDDSSMPIARRLYQAAPLHLAPISAGTLEPFSSPIPASPSPQKTNSGDRSQNRKHRRTPSEGGVFHMSSDEEVSSGPGGAVLNGNPNPNVMAPQGLFNSSASKTKGMHITTPTRPTSGVVRGPAMNMSTSVEKAAFFASSLFQNSPSPDELPDPLLL